MKAGERPLVISDGIFPTFGVVAPVPEYVKVLEPYQGAIWLDDAHAIGVLGPHGRGTYEYYGLASDNLFFGGTLSKACVYVLAALKGHYTYGHTNCHKSRRFR